MPAHERGKRLDAVNGTAELVLDLLHDRFDGGGIEGPRRLMGEIDLRGAARIVVDDARRFVHGLGDRLGRLRLCGHVSSRGAEDKEGGLAAQDIGRCEHLVDAAVFERDLRIRCGGEIARRGPGGGKESGHRVRMREGHDLALQPIVLAEGLLRLHPQQIRLRRGRRRHRDAVGRPEIGKRAHPRAIGQKRERQRAQARHGEDLTRAALALLPRREQRGDAERRDVDGAGSHSVLQRAGAEKALVGGFEVEMRVLAVLLDQLQILAQKDRQKGEAEPHADAHRLLCARRRGHDRRGHDRQCEDER